MLWSRAMHVTTASQVFLFLHRGSGGSCVSGVARWALSVGLYAQSTCTRILYIHHQQAWVYGTFVLLSRVRAKIEALGWTLGLVRASPCPTPVLCPRSRPASLLTALRVSSPSSFPGVSESSCCSGVEPPYAYPHFIGFRRLKLELRLRPQPGGYFLLDVGSSDFLRSRLALQ